MESRALESHQESPKVDLMDVDSPVELTGGRLCSGECKSQHVIGHCVGHQRGVAVLLKCLGLHSSRIRM